MHCNDLVTCLIMCSLLLSSLNQTNCSLVALGSLSFSGRDDRFLKASTNASHDGTGYG